MLVLVEVGDGLVEVKRKVNVRVAVELLVVAADGDEEEDEGRR